MADPSYKPAAAEHVSRRSERIDFVKRTIIHCLWGEDGEHSRAISLCDFSATGVGFFSDVPMSRGQQFVMRLATAQGPERELLYSIAYCRPASEGQYRIGAEFICIASAAEPAAAAKPVPDAMDRIRKAILD